MYRQRHYVLVYQENGTISLTVAWFGPFERHYFPIQMLDLYGRDLPQPYPDQPETIRNARWNINKGMWFVNLQDPPPQFAWHEITEEQFKQIAANPYAFAWEGKRLALRPGHVMNTRRTAAICQYADYLRQSHPAFGGRPVYQIRKWAQKTPDDFPEIRDAGLFHSFWREPGPIEIHPSLRARKIALADVQELTVQERLRTPMAMEVKLQKQASRLVMAPTGYVGGMGTN